MQLLADAPRPLGVAVGVARLIDVDHVCEARQRLQACRIFFVNISHWRTRCVLSTQHLLVACVNARKNLQRGRRSMSAEAHLLDRFVTCALDAVELTYLRKQNLCT